MQLELRLAVAVALTAPLVAIAMAGPLHFSGWEWAGLALSTPVVFWSGPDFHCVAFRSLRHGTATMDTLASVGTLAAWLWSTVVLDKTGAVTDGRMRVAGVVPGEGVSAAELVRLAGAAEAGSDHPIARAIAERAREELGELPAVESFRSRTGLGVEAVVEGRAVVFGRPSLLSEWGLELGTGADVTIEASDRTLVSGDLRAAVDAIRLSRRATGLGSAAEGVALGALGDSEGATTAFGTGIALLEETGQWREAADACTSWGRYLRSLGRSEEAVAAFDRAAALAGRVRRASSQLLTWTD